MSLKIVRIGDVLLDLLLKLINYFCLTSTEGLIWTAEPPVLRVGPNKSYELTTHTVATTDERKEDNKFKIQVVFALDNKQKVRYLY